MTGTAGSGGEQGRGSERDVDRLSERERDVLRLMAQGRSNSGIAAALSVSERTVETHTAGIFAGLGIEVDRADNRRVLAVLAWLASGRA